MNQWWIPPPWPKGASPWAFEDEKHPASMELDQVHEKHPAAVELHEV